MFLILLLKLIIYIMKNTHLYINLTEIGKGSFSTVYKALNQKKQTVALKKIHKNQTKSDEQFSQLNIMLNLKHQNIVPLYNHYFDEDSKQLVLEMQLAEYSLNKIIQQKRSLEQVIFYAIQIAQGLLYLHQNKIAHLDLKPENILVFQNKKQLKITDFGISRILNEEIQVTSSKSQLGSKNYRSPQREKQYIKSKCVDVWAFGIILIELYTSDRIMNLLKKYKIKKQQIKQLTLKIDFLQQDRKLKKIIDKCFRYFRKRPDMSQILDDLSQIINKNNDSQLFQLNQKIQQDPNDWVNYYKQAKIYKKQKKYLFAERNYKLAINKKKDFSQAYNDLGNIYFQQKMYELSEQNYKNALQYKQNFIDVYYNLGVLYQTQKKYSEAKDQYLQVLKLKQDHIYALHNISILLQSERNYLQAIKYYRKISQNSNDYKIHFNIAVLYQKSNQPDKAVDQYTLAIQLNNKSRQSYLNRGCLYKKAGNLQKARQDFIQAIKINDKVVNAYANLGIIYQEQGKHQQAIKQLNKAIKLQPNNKICLYNRAYIYQLQSSKCDPAEKKFIVQKSIKDYTKVVQLQDNFAQAYNNRGIMYLNSNENKKAIEDFTKAISLNKKEKRYYNHRAIAYYNINERTKAQQDYQKSQQIDVND